MLSQVSYFVRFGSDDTTNDGEELDAADAVVPFCGCSSDCFLERKRNFFKIYFNRV